MDRICYRKRKKYTKYKLEEPLSVEIDIKPTQEITQYKISLSQGGVLAVKERYTWDGPSGPALDTKNFMRASLVHDALYQLMRLSILDYKKYRKPADQIMKKLCRQDGMGAFRAWYVYWAVRIFAKSCARPQQEPSEKLYAP
jgi:hypothetical protein